MRLKKNKCLKLYPKEHLYGKPWAKHPNTQGSTQKCCTERRLNRQLDADTHMFKRTKSSSRCTFGDPKVSASPSESQADPESILMTVEFPKTCRSKTWCYLGMDGQLAKSIRHWINSAFVILALILVAAEPNLNAPQRVLHWWQFRTSRLYFKCLC